MADAVHRPRGLVWLTGGVALAGALWYAAHATVGAGPVAIGYTFVPVSGYLAAVAVHRLRRTVPLHPVAGRFWRGLLIAITLLSTGYAIRAVDAAGQPPGAPPPDMPIPATILVAVGFAVAMWAVARVPVDAVDSAERWRMRLDRTIAFLSCATVLWHFLLVPLLTADEPSSPQSVVLVALAFLLAVGGITKAAYVRTGPVHRTAMWLLAAVGLVAAVVALLIATYGRAGTLPALAAVMPVNALLVTLAARAQARSAVTPATPPRRTLALLPYLAVGAVDVPLVAVAFGPLDRPGRAVVFAAVVVTALVGVRQFLAYQENAALLRRMRGQEERLEHDATHDELTGLANRALFRQRLSAALAGDGGATVLLIDLDDFKLVNDCLGHDVGDGLLAAVAHAMRAAVGADGMPVRVGGDEFAVLLTGPGAPGEAVAQRVLNALAEPVGEHGFFVQASIGIATGSTGASLDDVLRRADVAMYAAKHRGKAGYLRYQPGMEEPVLAHIELGGELRRALDAGEFRVVYQPVMRLADRRVIGVEALVRWEHPTRGTVSPADFVPAAERTGLIIPLGRFVLRESCRQAAAWLAEFGPDALQKIAPNVSARQLHDPDFTAEVTAALADSGLPADRLVLELTESAVLRGREISRTLHGLDAMGVKLALDDFGTGESSLSLLRSFPAAIVKLDKSFVDGIEIEDPARNARQAVARAVIQLAAAFGLDAVAEGIENEAQVRKLRELGYTLGQGYHLARPMPPADLSRLLATQRAGAAMAAAAPAR